MRKGSKFDKKKCLKCKWHGTGIGYPVKISEIRHDVIHCNWSSYNDSACLKMVNGEVIDIRGDDYHHCKLFEEGKAEEKKIDYYGNLLRERN